MINFRMLVDVLRHSGFGADHLRVRACLPHLLDSRMARPIPKP